MKYFFIHCVIHTTAKKMPLVTDIYHFTSIAENFKKLKKEAAQIKIKVYSIYELEFYERRGSQGCEFVRTSSCFGYEAAVNTMKEIYEKGKDNNHSCFSPQLLLVQEIMAADNTFYTMNLKKAYSNNPSEGEFLYTHPDTKEQTLIKVTNIEPGIEESPPTGTAHTLPPNFKQLSNNNYKGSFHITAKNESESDSESD